MPRDNRDFLREEWNMILTPYDWSLEENSGTVRNPLATSMIITKTGSLHAWRVNAAGNTLETLLPWPRRIDPAEHVYFRVYWGSSSNDADTPVFKIGHCAQTDGAALNETPTLLTMPADTNSTTASKINITPWFQVNKGTFNRNTTYILQLETDALGSASANELMIFGLEIKGTPCISLPKNRRLVA